jgi:hypothetical protein
MSAPTMAVSRTRRRGTAEVKSGRLRAAARHRALARLAREYVDRYRELYAEERGESSC